jgi:hypothetical protein
MNEDISKVDCGDFEDENDSNKRIHNWFRVVSSVR